jgi:hypothetical protein
MNAQLPAHLAHRQKRDLATIAVGGINSGSPAHISIAGNRFTLVDEAGNQKPMQTLYLDVCVIDANAAVSKIFFDPRIPFEPGGDNSNPPICWSDNGIGASAQASQPQNSSCQLCPQNAWGYATSKATGKPVKACNDVKKVAVVAPGIDMVFLMRIPPASLKNWGKYCNTLAGHGVDLPDALTRISFESQGVLQFEPSPAGDQGTSFVDARTAAFTDKAIEGKATDVLIGRNDRPWGGQADAQKIAYAQAQPDRIAAPPAPVAQPMTPPPQPFSRAPAAGGFGAAPQTQTTAAPFAAPSAPDPFAQAGTSSPTDVTPAKKGRGPNKPKPEPVADDGIPPFLKRTAQTDSLGREIDPNYVEPKPNPTQFGMQQNPAAPDAGIQAALDAAFRLPT